MKIYFPCKTIIITSTLIQNLSIYRSSHISKISLFKNNYPFSNYHENKPNIHRSIPFSNTSFPKFA